VQWSAFIERLRAAKRALNTHFGFLLSLASASGTTDAALNPVPRNFL
jgi:hypothetical protein